MSKRNIRGKSGKQLYLNQLFLGGMKYTSSEMTEGVAKVISNFDISPTGDSAMPRTAFTSKKLSSDISKYFYPVKFNQAINEQHYIEFINTVSEDDYVNDEVDSLDVSYAPIKFYSRTIGDITKSTTTIEGIITSGKISNPASYLEELIEQNMKPVTITDIGPHTEYDFFESAIFEELSIGSFFVMYNNYEYVYIKSGEESCVSFTNTWDVNFTDFEVHDGDTYTKFPELTNSVRLLGIDAPEIGTNWSATATRMLDYISNVYFYNNDIKYFDHGKDNHGRQLLEIYFYTHDGNLYSLSETMVRCGLAKVAYMFDDYLIQNSLYEAQNYAKEKNLCLYSGTIDPLLDASKNKLQDMIVDDKPYYSPEKYRYEFVRTTDTKAVNSLLSNVNDTVQFQYIDYLDSIGILGRILNSDGTIVYKGLMYIKPVVGLLGLNFIIELPPNNLDGEEIDIITSQETGYNLMNSNLINLEDSNDGHLVAGIKGLVVTDSTNKNIIMKATRGQQVNLHAVMNYGYTNIGNYLPTPFFRAEYQLVKTIITDKYTVIKDEEGNEINRNPVLETKVSSHTIDLINGNSYTVVSASDAEKIYSVKFRFTKLELIIVTSDGEVKYDVSSQIHDLWKKGTEWNGRTLENTFGMQGEAILNLATNNLGVFNIQFDKTSFTNVTYIPDWNTESIIKEYKPILYLEINIGNLMSEDYMGNYHATSEVEITDKIFSKWEKAKYGTDLEKDDGWVTISDKESYTIEDNILKPTSDNSEDITWVVDELSNISLKYTIYRQLYVKIGDLFNFSTTTIKSPESIYLAMPLFKVSHTAEFLDQEDILNNVNIKDATRIGIFNRQLYLYGPKTKANFLQFSMFEEQWYLPFPYYNIEIPEPIVYVYPYLDSLVVFGKYNIYMLTGGVGVLDLKLHKIYENLSITAADVNLVNTVGTYLMFFNNNIGYLMVPNTYSDDPTNIKVYKLTDNISNALLNPEPLIKAITNKIGLNGFASTIFANYTTFVDSNVLYIAANYTWARETTEYKSCIIYRYNQTYKYWNLYYSPTFTELNNPYIAEPQLGVQYITTDENVKRLTFLNSVHIDPVDKVYDGNDATKTDIETYLDTGYLSVDTMNDKRFKDIIVEFDNIKRNKDDSDMYIHCNFFIDGTPMLISEPNNIQVENQYGNVLGDIEPHIPLKEEPFNTILYHISDSNRDSNDPFVIDSTYGVAFKLDDSMYTNVGRTHVRIPVFGKGRLPSFTLRIVTKNNYEFINYSLIYKEKNINRRR